MNDLLWFSAGGAMAIVFICILPPLARLAQSSNDLCRTLYSNWQHRKRKKWTSFEKTLFSLVVVLGFACGWLAYEVRFCHDQLTNNRIEFIPPFHETNPDPQYEQ